ncbi:MAG: hypothetical protein ACLR1G_00260 [Alistipes indistinctus]
MKILINSKYEYLRPFVEQLTRPIFFARHGKTLHSGRNIVKLFETDGMRLAVKSYERLSPLCNRIAVRLACARAKPCAPICMPAGCVGWESTRPRRWPSWRFVGGA